VDPCEITNHPYTYLGYAFSDEMCATPQQIVVFFDNVKDFGQRIYQNAFVVDSDWQFATPLPGNYTQAYRLREGIERFFITDINNPAATTQAQSSLAIMLDNIADAAERFNHVPGGANILYLDGHVEFVLYPKGQTAGGPVLEDDPLPFGGPFPMNGAGIAIHIANHIFAPGEEGIESGFYQSVPWPGSDFN
jgi:prepilin-type processing-associated H-X9-DG protein